MERRCSAYVDINNNASDRLCAIVRKVLLGAPGTQYLGSQELLLVARKVLLRPFFARRKGCLSWIVPSIYPEMSSPLSSTKLYTIETCTSNKAGHLDHHLSSMVCAKTLQTSLNLLVQHVA